MKTLMYTVISLSLDTKLYGNDVALLMDKIREQIKTISFERISLDGYSPDDFKDLQLKEKVYFDCLVNYGLVNDDDVRKFLATCLGKEYLRRYKIDINFFGKRGLGLARTTNGAALHRRRF